MVVIFFVAYGLEAIWPALMARLPEGTRIFTLLYNLPNVRPTPTPTPNPNPNPITSSLSLQPT